jgi:putative hydrolase of the HAD superfamily
VPAVTPTEPSGALKPTALQPPPVSLAAVVFDLDYTLAVPERDRQTLLDETTAAAGVRDIDRQEYLDAHGSDLASETRAPIFDALLDEGDPRDVARAYRRAVNDSLVPVAGAADLVADLRERYRVGVLTDGPVRAQRSKLEALGWTDLFDGVVVTGALPAGKPDPRTFEAVLDELGATPGETVHVGDHPVADVRGAAEAGLLAVQVLDGRYDRAPEADAYVQREELVAKLRDRLLRQTSLP